MAVVGMRIGKNLLSVRRHLKESVVERWQGKRAFLAGFSEYFQNSGIWFLLST
jgi:hypothetical protein